MNLYIVRHGEAVRVGEAIPRDADRVLTPRGEQDARHAGKALALLDGSVRLILTSPLVRAVQTGKLIGDAFADEVNIQSSDLLVPGFRYKALLDALAALKSGGSVVLVAHQPDLTNFISWLIADESYASIGMVPAAVAYVTIEPPVQSGETTLRWLLTPEIVTTLVPQN
jgi:phosphohistidine phosphatase